MINTLPRAAWPERERERGEREGEREREMRVSNW
jgi:hypothetical protein